MIRKACPNDRGDFMVLWAEFLHDAHKAGSEVLPTPRNLQISLRLFDLYTMGELEGVVLIARDEDEKLIGVTMSGEPMRGQLFDCAWGRVATGWGTYVREAFRGDGWSRKLRKAMAKACKNMGFDVVAGPIAFTNTASLESCKKLGIETPSVVAVKRLEGY